MTMYVATNAGLETLMTTTCDSCGQVSISQTTGSLPILAVLVECRRLEGAGWVIQPPTLGTDIAWAESFDGFVNLATFKCWRCVNRKPAVTPTEEASQR